MGSNYGGGVGFEAKAYKEGSGFNSHSMPPIDNNMHRHINGKSGGSNLIGLPQIR